jgi:hypothetical protein
MTRRWFVAAVALTGLLCSSPALAANPVPGDLGYDVAEPQCDNLPMDGTFGIVSVTDGLPWNQNPCLQAQTDWAARDGQSTPALYVNTANPGPPSIHWGTGRVPCRDTSSYSDVGCAYGYGWNAAGDAITRAKATITAFDPLVVTWWLDVETANSWNGTTDANTADLQGYADRLRSAGIPSVGIYAPPAHWTEITGGFTKTTAAAYRSRWSSTFAPLYPLELGPTWLPKGEVSADVIAQACTQAAVTGGQVLMTQREDATYDYDLQCALESTDTSAPVTTMTAPAVATTLSTKLPIGWSAPAGTTSFDARYRRSPHNGPISSQIYPAAWQVTTARSMTMNTAAGSMYCVSARARDARPNLGRFATERCSVVPLDDRHLTASTGWSRFSSTAYFLNTFSTSTRYGATLSRSGLQTSRLSLVATKCSFCGVVGVYVGSTLLAKVNLYAATTKRKVVIPLPRFSLRTTTVTLKVLSSGKTVQVDGLATSRG